MTATMAQGTGLAFSGGGIRSAAFCSGVLRRLLDSKVEVDYLSCVSGGGYTGTAFLDWKYRNEKKADDDGGWYKEFFDHMQQRSGYICNWEKWWEGVADTIIFLFLVLLVSFIGPIIIYGSYAFPVAFIIDFLFGKLLREEVDCEDVAATQSRRKDLSTQSATEQSVFPQAILKHCLDRQGTQGFYTFILFSVLLALFILFFALAKRCSRRRYSNPLSFIHTTLIVLLALTFFPFAIHDCLSKIPVWSQYFLVFMGVMVWFFLPLLRSKTSYVLLIYFYSYVVHWKVYEARLLGIEFSEELFNLLLFVCGLALWIVPLLSASRRRLVHIYNRWRLQKAFYHPDSIGTAGCAGIRIQDVFQVLDAWKSRCRQLRMTNSYENVNNLNGTNTAKPLSLADLKHIKPEYLSNMVINRWKENEQSAKNYELLTMSPTVIERLDRDPNKPTQFEGKLEPADVKLSAAMATSAAALSEHMGKYDLSVKGLTRFHTLIGFEMGATMITDLKSVRNESFYMKILPFLLDVARGLPLISVVFYSGIDEASVTAAVLTFFAIHLALALIIVLIDTGSGNPKRLEEIARWFIVHNNFVHFVSEMFSKDNCGPMPPPVMLLSDGGHFENLALLPLLKKRLKKIIVVDGGYKDDLTQYRESLLNALMLAREKLGCSFLSYEGGDVDSDIMEKFVKPNAKGKYLRYYRFQVQYKRDESIAGSGGGEILLIAPRKPDDGAAYEMDGSRSTDLNPSYPVLDEPDGPTLEDVKKLTFCCCECCHRTSCHGCSSWLCKAFPQHITANQFFTPLMFKAYHDEGYRACKQAKAAEFMNVSQQSEDCVRPGD